MEELIRLIIENEKLYSIFYNVILKKFAHDGYLYYKEFYELHSKEYIKSNLPKSSEIYFLYESNFPTTIDELYSKLVTAASDLNSSNNIILDSLEQNAIVNYVVKSFNNNNMRKDFILKLIDAAHERNNLMDIYKCSSNEDFVWIDNKEIVKISSIQDFLDEIFALPERNQYFFRGHSNINYMLVPSIMRRKEWMTNENKLYQEVVIRCPSDFVDCNSHLDFLVKMQHYDLPTRLLDITSNPLVALYFACENTENKIGEVIIISPSSNGIKYSRSDTVSLLSCLPMFSFEDHKKMYSLVDDKNIDKDKFNSEDVIKRLVHEIRIEKPAFRNEIIKEDMKKCLIVKTQKSNSRIIRQDGAFVICGLISDEAFQTEAASKNHFVDHQLEDMRALSKKSNKIIFAVENKKEILKQLDRLGINKASLFPEVDDVSTYLKNNVSRI